MIHDSQVFLRRHHELHDGGRPEDDVEHDDHHHVHDLPKVVEPEAEEKFVVSKKKTDGESEKCYYYCIYVFCLKLHDIFVTTFACPSVNVCGRNVSMVFGNIVFKRLCKTLRLPCKNRLHYLSVLPLNDGGLATRFWRHQQEPVEVEQPKKRNK